MTELATKAQREIQPRDGGIQMRHRSAELRTLRLTKLQRGAKERTERINRDRPDLSTKIHS